MMCNAYRMNSAVKEIADTFSQLQLPLAVRFPEGIPNLEPREIIKITETAPIVRMGDGAAQLVQRPWSWKGPNGAPVFNFRGEGRRFAPESRCAIPTDGFYEFTTADDPKAKRKDRWLFTMAGEPLFFVAGYMRGEAWTMLTVEPGPDVAPIHNRQIVVMDPVCAADWLKGAPEADVVRPARAGTLRVERA